jgi:hypothetical protein
MSWGLIGALAVIVVGCNSPQKPPPVEKDRTISSSEDMWEHQASKNGDEFMVRVVVRKVDTWKNAENDARHQAMSTACDMATKDYLRDMSKYDKNRDEIKRQILDQPNKYVKSSRVVETRRFDNDEKFGMYMAVTIDDQRLKNVLQDLGMIRQEIADKQILIVVYGGKNVEKDLVADTGRELAKWYNQQGYNATLWDDIATDIAEERNVGEKATEDFIQKFVENPEFAGDTEYQGTLSALRSRGRLVVGFNVIKVSVQGRTVNAAVKAFVKDMLQGRVFGNQQEPVTRTMAMDADRDIAISQACFEAAKKCSEKIVKETNDWYDKLERQGVGTEYTFRFSGFTEDEVQQIDKQWRATFSTGGDGHMEGTVYVRTYKGEEKGSQLCDKVDMMLKKGSLKARKPMPDSRATTFEFKKQ